MSTGRFYPRFVERRLAEALEDSPVVLIHGPRQCGKTTLAQLLCAPDYLKWGDDFLTWGGERLSWGMSQQQRRDYKYISFDDVVARDGAHADPMGFVADLPERVILDEIQRVPKLFAALKLEVDRRRTPGRFILIGSTNVLLIPKLSDSLAGRLQIVPLHPLAQQELAVRSGPVFSSETRPGFLDALFGDGFEIQQTKRLGKELFERIIAGGFPAALTRPTARRQANWYRDYVEAQVQRDVRDVARVRMLDVLPRLLSAAASQTARLYNLSDLAGPFQLSRPTIGGYIELFERLFLLKRIPSWHTNRLSRLIKTPKLHVGDTGLAAALLGARAAALMADRVLLGQLVETFVFQELQRQASWNDASTGFFHFRDKDGVEVDIVIEREERTVAGVEVKAAATVTLADFRGLRKLAKTAGTRFASGVVLYDGETCTRFGDRLYAVPIRRLWET